jgi:hypothetical protein
MARSLEKTPNMESKKKFMFEISYSESDGSIAFATIPAGQPPVNGVECKLKLLLGYQK